MNFTDEIKHIKTKFLKADYPLRFVYCIVTNFQFTMDVEDFIHQDYLMNVNLLF